MNENEKKKYWNNYYATNLNIPTNQSSFSEFVCDDLKKRGVNPSTSLKIIDIGCGNGRDTLAFALTGYLAVGIDASIENSNSVNATFIQQNALSFEHYKDFDIIYARFFLHTLTDDEQTELFKRFANCKQTCLFYFECRSADDKMLLKGNRLSIKENMTDHYRRYQTSNELLHAVKEFCFPISIETVNNVSIVNDDNPSLIRFIGCKEKFKTNEKASIPQECLSFALKRLYCLLSSHVKCLIPAYGTLLGLVREGEPIDGDDDLDFWILKDDELLIKNILNASGYKLQLNKKNFFYFTDYSGIQSDFYILEKNDTYFIDKWSFWGQPEKINLNIPKEFLFPLELVNDIKLPNEREKLVEYLYGKRYREKLRKHIDYQSVCNAEGIYSIKYL